VEVGNSEKENDMSKTMDKDLAPVKDDRISRPRPNQEEVDAGVAGTDRVPTEKLPPGVRPKLRPGTPPRREEPYF